jgi:hypothetical protein
MPDEEKQPPQPHYPATVFTVAENGILCETFYSPTISTRLIIPELTANDLFKQWITSRQKLQKQQQLISDVMRSKLH